MNTNSKDSKNLIGRDVDIQLYYANDLDDRFGKPRPQLPEIQCRLLKRIFSFTWNYIAELPSPLFLDQDGIKDNARNKMSANYVLITPGCTYTDKKDDNLYYQLAKEGKVDVIVSYIKDPADVPNELLTGAKSDPYFKEMPVIASGVMTLKK